MELYRVIVKCSDAALVVNRDGANAFQYEKALQIKKDMELVVNMLNDVEGTNKSVVEIVKI